jgi:hypothetical protein
MSLIAPRLPILPQYDSLLCGRVAFVSFAWLAERRAAGYLRPSQASLHLLQGVVTRMELLVLRMDAGIIV